MKKILAILCIVALAVGCVLPASAEAPEITFDDLTAAVSPLEITANGPFSYTMVYSNTGDEMTEGMIQTRVFAMNGEYCEFNQITVYTDGYEVCSYCTNDPADPGSYYLCSDGEADASHMREDEVESIFEPILHFDEATEIVSTEVVDDNVVLSITRGSVSYDLTLDADGRVSTVVVDMIIEGIDGPVHMDISFDYSEDITIDYSAKEANPDFDPLDVPVYEGKVNFDTTDINDEEVTTEELLEGAKIVMLNLWEPWCKPCTGEMPDLQKLYENYKDQGLLIVGVYSSDFMNDEAKQIVEELGITYPILHANEELLALEQEYVPATFFLFGDGEILTPEPIAGANTYEGWEEMIVQLLQLFED